MFPKMQMVVEQTRDSDYVVVDLILTIPGDNGEKYEWVAYSQLHLELPMNEDMSIEAWTLATLSNVTNKIQYRLSSQLGQGSQTLARVVREHQRH